jgi:P27 family predicted phage terminase small subunit
MGRTPDPVALKLLKGTGKGRDQAGMQVPIVPAFERGAPVPPDWLSPPARALWDQLAPSLAALDIIKPEDYTTFVTYCEAWATYREALERVRFEGLTSSHPKTGMPHKNPSYAILEAAGHQLLRLAQEFGLTPAAELRLARGPAVVVDEDDPFDVGEAQAQ